MESQFRHVRISLIPPKPKTSLDAKYHVGISEACTQLGLNSTPEFKVGKLSSLDTEFKQACADSYCQHAEMQLISHYEDGAIPPPTFDYFGCSKKTCLLCETFLKALPRPIATRGRHGICYPAWGLPCSRSAATKTGLNTLENDLLSRINQNSYSAHVPQSSIVSDFSTLTMEDWQLKEQTIESFKNEETRRKNELQITEGLAPTSRSTDHSRQLFEPEDSCVMCNASPARQCSRCRSCYYCSRQCQESDFRSHKLLCKQYSSQSSRPSREHRRAIYFPADQAKPRMIWVACRGQTDEDGIPWTEVDSSLYLGADNPVKNVMRVEYNPVRDRNLGSGFVAFAPRNEGYCVSLIHRDAYLIDGSAINRSISASVGQSSLLPHQYCGPMVAVRQLPHECYDDITLADFRHLIDYLVSYNSTHVRESIPNQVLRARTAVRGAKICCYGEIRLHGSEPFISVDVTRATRFASGHGTISPISSRLGMPLLLWKYRADGFWSDPPGWEENISADSNPNAAFLMTETDPSRPKWGWVHNDWNREIGNVLVLRADGEDLVLDHLSMMCNFAVNTLQRMFEDTMDSGGDKLEVLNFITWENMVDHWNKINDD